MYWSYLNVAVVVTCIIIIIIIIIIIVLEDQAACDAACFNSCCVHAFRLRHLGRPSLSGVHGCGASGCRVSNCYIQDPSPISTFGVKSPHLQLLRVNQLFSTPTSSNTTSLNSRKTGPTETPKSERAKTVTFLKQAVCQASQRLIPTLLEPP